MRRHEQEITDPAIIESILHKSMVCRIGLVRDNLPYVVPVCFGYGDGFIYIHSAHVGEKIDIIKANNNVCFEVDVDVELVRDEAPCKWSVNYRSVIGFGKASLIEDPAEKIEAFNIIMEHYSGTSGHEYHEALLGVAAIIKIEIDRMTGKKSKE